MFHHGSRFRSMSSRRSVRTALVGAALAAITGLAAFSGTQAHAAGSSTDPVIGQGFDACGAPSSDAMHAWSQGNSPYKSVGIYIGGANRGCPDGNLSAAWVQQVRAMGWTVIPTYVGVQAPTTTAAGTTTIDPAQAGPQGQQDASDAVNDAKALGIGPGSAIFFDLEGYTRGPGPSGTVDAFLASWNSELHKEGYVSGVYSSLNSGIADMVDNPAARSDMIWFAHWDGSGAVQDPAIPADLWANHQRIKQFKGGDSESYGNAQLNVDSDSVDATLVQPPAPTPSGENAVKPR